MLRASRFDPLVLRSIYELCLTGAPLAYGEKCTLEWLAQPDRLILWCVQVIRYARITCEQLGGGCVGGDMSEQLSVQALCEGGIIVSERPHERTILR